MMKIWKIQLDPEDKRQPLDGPWETSAIWFYLAWNFLPYTRPLSSQISMDKRA